MKYLVGALFLLVSVAANAAFLFGGMVSQGSGQAQAGSTSAGGSVGPGVYATYGISGAAAGSQAQAGVNSPGINFTSSGASGVLSGSSVGGFSNGQAAGGSIAGAAGAAQHFHGSGFILSLP